MTSKYICLVLFIALLWSCNSEYSDNQKYILPDGLYNIISYPQQFRLQTSLDSVDSTDIVTFDSLNQIHNFPWSLKHIGGKEYQVQAHDLKKYLTLMDDALILSEENNNEAQVWIIHRYKDQKFKIINKSQIFCLCLPGKNAEKNIITTRKCNNRPGEYWLFEKVAE